MDDRTGDDGGYMRGNGIGKLIDLSQQIGSLTAEIEALQRQQAEQAHDRKLMEALAGLPEQIKRLNQDILEVKLVTAQWKDAEAHRREHLRQIERRQDALWRGVTTSLQVLMTRLAWPVFGALIALVFQISHGGATWQPLTWALVAISVVVTLAALGATYVTMQRTKTGHDEGVPRRRIGEDE